MATPDEILERVAQAYEEGGEDAAMAELEGIDDPAAVLALMARNDQEAAEINEALREVMAMPDDETDTTVDVYTITIRQGGKVLFEVMQEAVGPREALWKIASSAAGDEFDRIMKWTERNGDAATAE